MADSLIVPVGVNLEPFKASMDEAARIAQGAVNNIQESFNNANVGLGGNIMQGIAQGFGQGLYQSLTNMLKMLMENIDAMTKLGQQAKLTGTDVATFQELMNAGVKGGLASKDAAADLVKVASALNDANRNENQLTKLLDANNIRLKDAKGHVIGIAEAMQVAATLIANARSELDKVKVAELLGLSKEWIETLQGGPKALAEAATEMRNSGATMSKEMIDQAAKFEKSWRDAMINLGRGSKEWLLPIIETLNSAMNAINVIQARGRLQAGTASGADLAAIEAEARSPGGMGQGSRVLKKQIEERRAQLAAEVQPDRPAPVTAKDKGTVIPASKEAEDQRTRFDAATESVQRHTAALVADANAVGMTTGKHEQFRAELKLLDAARQDDEKITDEQIARYGELRRSMEPMQALQAAGITLTKEQDAAFTRLSISTKAAADRADEAKRKFEGQNEALRYGGNQLVDILDQATQKGAKFGDIMEGVFRNLAKQMLLSAVTGEGAFAKMFGTASTTGGAGGLAGLLGGLFKGGGTSEPIMMTGTAGSLAVPTFAEGGTIPPGGLAYVGEHGPNPRMIRAGSEPIMVTPNSVAAGGGGASIVGPTTNVVIQGSADKSTMALMQQMLAQRDRRFIADVAAATSELRRRSVRT